MLAFGITVTAIAITAVYFFLLKDYFWQKKVLKKWKKKSSPDILKLLDDAKSKNIRIVFMQFYDWEGYYEWTAYLFTIPQKTIMISIDPKTKNVLPQDHFIQKIIFSHEICHCGQEKEFFEVKFYCKYFLGNPCLFLELDNWKKTFLFMQKLNLLHDDEEKNKFCDFVHSKPKQEMFAICLQKTKDSSCPKAAELNKILKQFP